MKKGWLLAGVLLLLPGCMKENVDDCGIPGEGKLTVHFTYTGRWGTDEFPTRVNEVELLVFDKDARYMESCYYSQTDLREFQGAELHLPSGTYHLVYWGNRGSRSRLSELTEGTSIHAARLFYDSTLTGDSLYYAPRKTTTAPADISLYKVEVPSRGTEEVTVDFMTAYYTINVYVKGLDDRIGSNNQLPRIRVDNLPEGYDLHLAPGEYGTTLNQRASAMTVAGEDVSFASFLTTHFDVENPVQIHVIRATTEEIAHTVDLETVLKENNYQLVMGEHVTIDVHIEFTKEGVVVTLKLYSWGGAGVEPIY